MVPKIRWNAVFLRRYPCGFCFKFAHFKVSIFWWKESSFMGVGPVWRFHYLFFALEIGTFCDTQMEQIGQRRVNNRPAQPSMIDSGLMPGPCYSPHCFCCLPLLPASWLPSSRPSCFTLIFLSPFLSHYYHAFIVTAWLLPSSCPWCIIHIFHHSCVNITISLPILIYYYHPFIIHVLSLTIHESLL